MGEAYVLLAKAGNVVNGQLFNFVANDNPTYEELKISAAKAAGWKGEVKWIKVEKPEFPTWGYNVVINPEKVFGVSESSYNSPLICLVGGLVMLESFTKWKCTSQLGNFSGRKIENIGINCFRIEGEAISEGTKESLANSSHGGYFGVFM